MFNLRSKYLISFITLGYKTEFRDKLTVEVLRLHRNKLFNSNKALEGVLAQTWKIKQNADGLCLNLLLYYDANEELNAADKIGEYWIAIATGGKGEYIRDRGPRYLDRRDTRINQYVIRAIESMCKDNEGSLDMLIRTFGCTVV
jgi:hypothetical protein